MLKKETLIFSVFGKAKLVGRSQERYPGRKELLTLFWKVSWESVSGEAPGIVHKEMRSL